MELDDYEYLPISGLEHLAYCERQCALIHVDGVWADNAHTARGNILHRRVDEGEGSVSSEEGGVARRVALCSRRLRLVGFADAVEFRPREGQLVPYPVEYKAGSRRVRHHDDLQLAAQALALEEMTGLGVPEGAIFYGKTQRRRVVRIDEALRQATEAAARRFHELVKARRVPAAELGPKCRECSLRGRCLPDLPPLQRDLDAALAAALRS
jgi:CRISPR-associated exonuclease Cas4